MGRFAKAKPDAIASGLSEREQTAEPICKIETQRTLHDWTKVNFYEIRQRENVRSARALTPLA
jgi:hypothetical protein